MVGAQLSRSGRGKNLLWVFRCLKPAVTTLFQTALQG